ncbi:outer membrane protein [Salmonella enterica subsp. enterica]|nr:outer membrane protein [Salmonella enterica subsp. enterica]
MIFTTVRPGWQALTFGYKVAEVVDLRLEGTWVKADGPAGLFSATYDANLRLFKRSSGYLVG